MNKKKNNKGFSLVELIIVIAIMAILVGVLAPQYLKYVNNSRVSTDIQNADAIATAVNTLIADNKLTTVTTATTITIDATTAANTTTDTGLVVTEINKVPAGKATSGSTWVITYTTAAGCTGITLNGTAIYPDGETSAYYTANHK